MLSETILSFFKIFHVTSALKAANAYKKKGVPVASVFQYLFLLVKCWNIEVFFKVCRSYLRLTKECRSLSYDAMTVHVAIVFARYVMLSVENRESQDEWSLGELFLYFSDELADITWLESLKLLMELFRSVMKKCLELSDETISALVDIFISGIPSEIQTMLKAA